MQRNRHREAESGNAFFFIMLGVVLFAALMFTFSRGARQGGGDISAKQAELAAVDILNYSQKLSRATDRVQMKGFSQSQLSFENSFLSGYENDDCAEARCLVFDPAGGAAKWDAPPPNISGAAWIINGRNAVPDVGTAAPDLTLLLPGLTMNTCIKLNDALDVENPDGEPPEDSNAIDVTLFDGEFAAAQQIGEAAELSGVQAACVMHTDPDPVEFIFYSVLLAR